MDRYEVIVIGAGAAGLAASIALGRSRRSVLVFDAGSPRNAASHSAHNLLGQEGASPSDLLTRARSEALGYNVGFTDQNVTGISGTVDEGFTVHCAEASYLAQRIVLATGSRDQLPPLPGVQRGWGVSVLHCPYCHGWEVRDQKIAVLGLGPMSTHQALLFAQLSEEVSFINHEPQELVADSRRSLEAAKIPIIEDQVARLQVGGSGQLESVILTKGASLEFDAVVVSTRLQANAQLYLQLGGELAEHPMGQCVAADPRGLTDIPGVYAAGNITDPSSMIMASAASGVMAGAAVNADLIMASIERLKQQSKT